MPHSTPSTHQYDGPTQAVPVACQRLVLREDSPHVFAGQAHATLCVVAAGSAVYRRGDLDQRIGPGGVILLGPHRALTFERTRGMAVYHAAFLADWLIEELSAAWGEAGVLPLLQAAALFRGGRPAPLARLTLDTAALRAVARELDDLAAATADRAPSRLYLKAALLKVMALLATAYARESGTVEDTGVFSVPVTRVLEEIEHSLAQGEPFRVADAAAAAALTSDHLGRLFREATGETPRAYYQRRRAQVAASLLLDPARSISQVARQLGYCDTAHFCNAFKRLQGVSPAAYRKRMHGGPD